MKREKAACNEFAYKKAACATCLFPKINTGGSEFMSNIWPRMLYWLEWHHIYSTFFNPTR
jgi:hypothetical protein